MSAIIDLRSDTVTRPTDAMRQAMAAAEVGDDVYGDDPTVQQLEAESAALMGKEAALFVPTGTFGNQLAILAHTAPGNEVILAEDSHIIQHEAGAAALISGVQLRQVQTGQPGLPGQAGQAGLSGQAGLTAAKIEPLIRKDPEDIHYPATGLICLENALGNGKVMPLADMKDIFKLSRKYKIPVHLDGARIFNAAEFLRLEPSAISKYSDTVMFCLSKGLCAPIGSVLAGKADFITHARRLRKMLGGGMRQIGILAAAGLLALEMRRRLKKDHKHARLLGKWLGQVKGITLRPQDIQINMVFCAIKFAPPLTAQRFTARLLEQNIIVHPPDADGLFRFVTHNDISESDVRAAADVIEAVLTRDFW